jgi:hypothetical protein
MTEATRSAATNRGARVWGAVAAVLLIVATASLTLGLRHHQHPLAGPVVPPTSLTTVPVPVPATVPVVARSTPVSLRVPAISLSTSLSTLGLNPDGTVQVPDNDTEPGWFRLGPTPGQIGSAVILGHVDSRQGPGVFFQLRTLLPGDQVQVSLTDGAVATFEVTSVATYTKTQFPAQQVYASHGASALQLVTCGGTFDNQTGHYLSNIVVYTSFLSATPATAVVPTTDPVSPVTTVQI